jgi:hypothetical protein
LFSAEQAETRRLAIAWTTDATSFELLIRAFQSGNPHLAIPYLETDNLAPYRGFLAARQRIVDPSQS